MSLIAPIVREKVERRAVDGGGEDCDDMNHVTETRDSEAVDLKTPTHHPILDTSRDGVSQSRKIIQDLQQ